MKRFTLLVALVFILFPVACAINHTSPCTEMTWPDPTGGQRPPQHLGVEEAALWSSIAWVADNKVAATDPVVTPCGDQLSCAKVARFVRGMGHIVSVERCVVKWVPQ